jgi:hypothetical protein
MFDIISIGKKIALHSPVWKENRVEVRNGNEAVISNLDNVISTEVPTHQASKIVTDLFVTNEEPTKVIMYNRIDKTELRKIDFKAVVVKILTVSNTFLSNQFMVICATSDTDLTAYVVKYSDKNARKHELKLLTVNSKIVNAEDPNDVIQIKTPVVEALLNSPEFIADYTTHRTKYYMFVRSKWDTFLGSENQLSTVAKVLMSACCLFMSSGRNMVVIRQMAPTFRNSNAVGSPGLLELNDVCAEYSLNVYFMSSLQFNEFKSYRGVLAGLFDNCKIVFFNRVLKHKLVHFLGSDITSFCFNKTKLFTVVNGKQVYIYNNFDALYHRSINTVNDDITEKSINKVKAVIPENDFTKVMGDLSDSVAFNLPTADVVIDIEEETDYIEKVKCFNNGDHELLVFIVNSTKDNKTNNVLYGVRNNSVIFKHKFADTICDVDYNITNAVEVPERRAASGSTNVSARVRLNIEEILTVKLASGCDSFLRLELTNNSSASTVVRDIHSERVENRAGTHNQIARFLDI